MSCIRAYIPLQPQALILGPQTVPDKDVHTRGSLLALHRGHTKDGGAVGETERVRAIAALFALIQHTPEAQLAFLEVSVCSLLAAGLGLGA